MLRRLPLSQSAAGYKRAGRSRAGQNDAREIRAAFSLCLRMSLQTHASETNPELKTIRNTFLAERTFCSRTWRPVIKLRDELVPMRDAASFFLFGKLVLKLVIPASRKVCCIKRPAFFSIKIKLIWNTHISSILRGSSWDSLECISNMAVRCSSTKGQPVLQFPICY